MIDVFSRRLRVAMIAAGLCGATLDGAAQEKNVTDATSAPSAAPDGITSAKREFDALRATRDAGLQPKSELPRMSLPEWPSAFSAPSPSTGTPAKNPPPKTKKSSNWLVDAMQKPATRDSRNGANEQGRERGGRENERDRQRSSTRVSGGDEDIELTDKADAPTDRAQEKRDERERKNATEGAVNPLTRYLGDWMTPQDYALLKPGLSQPLAPGSDPKNPAGLNNFGAGVAGVSTQGVADSGLDFSAASTRPVFVPPTPRENPFLQSLALPSESPMIGSLSKPGLPAVTSAPPPAATIAPAPEPPPVQSKIPDFARPTNDDKYFKQLKRF